MKRNVEIKLTLSYLWYSLNIKNLVMVQANTISHAARLIKNELCNGVD